ncbi:MAG: ACT domain-containing protein [Actinomycetota bacterium]
MNAFICEIKNLPGEQARVTEALAARKINVLNCSLGIGDQGVLGIVANDETGTRSVLTETGFSFTEVPVVTVKLLDKPGQTARISRLLADAGINIDLFLPLGTGNGEFVIAIGVNDVEGARRVLRSDIVEFTYN